MFSYVEHKYIKGKVLREVSVKVCRFPLHCPPMQGYSLNWRGGGGIILTMWRGAILYVQQKEARRIEEQPSRIYCSWVTMHVIHIWYTDCRLLVFTTKYLRMRVQSSVWRLPKHWPPSSSPPSECVIPPHHRQGVHTTHSPGGEGVGGQYFGRR